jgi:hypothetical protein
MEKVELYYQNEDGTQEFGGTMQISPRMKMKDLAANYFGDEPQDESSLAYLCLCALEDFYEYLNQKKNLHMENAENELYYGETQHAD